MPWTQPNLVFFQYLQMDCQLNFYSQDLSDVPMNQITGKRYSWHSGQRNILRGWTNPTFHLTNICYCYSLDLKCPPQVPYINGWIPRKVLGAGDLLRGLQGTRVWPSMGLWTESLPLPPLQSQPWGKWLTLPSAPNIVTQHSTREQ